MYLTNAVLLIAIATACALNGEHRNTPLEDGLVTLARNLNAYVSNLRVGSEQQGMGFLLNQLADGKHLSIAELERIILHLQERRDRLVEAEGGKAPRRIPLSQPQTGAVLAAPKCTTAHSCYNCVTPNFTDRLQRVFGLYLKPRFPLVPLPDCLNNTNNMTPLLCSSSCYELYVDIKTQSSQHVGKEVAVLRSCRAYFIDDIADTIESCEAGPLSLENWVPGTRAEGVVQQRICATKNCNNKSGILSHCNKPKVGTCHDCSAIGETPDVKCRSDNVCLGAYCTDQTLFNGKYQNVKGCISVNPHKNATGCYHDSLGRYCWNAAA